jgi:hypothetical protein
MAYAIANPPRLISQGVGASAGSLWHYTDGDDLPTVLAADYFSDGFDLGMKVNDTVLVTDETNTIVSLCVASVVTADGAATIQKSEGPGAALISGTGATLTLTAAQSGANVLFDRAAGIVFDLPAPVVGLKFRFIVTVDLTAAAYQVDTDAATTFIVGSLVGAIEAAATDETHFADGTTHIGLSMNKTTTGGLIGGIFDVECISATLWAITGNTSCTATPATPFTT